MKHSVGTKYDVSRNKGLLPEVALIRPILILLLVLYHSFAPWCGSWQVFEGFEPNIIYKTIGRLAYSFMLPMFCFISGYIWAYQREYLCKKGNFSVLLIKKLKRLYLPCLLFSLLYFLLYDAEILMGGVKIGTVVLDIIDGYAHLWFLPMLLWCFLFCYGILLIKNITCQYLMVILLWVGAAIQFPFQISTAFYYLMFFFIGYRFRLRAEYILSTINVRNIFICWSLFAIVYVGLTAINGYVVYSFGVETSDKSFLYGVFYNLIRTSYGLCGIIAMFQTALFLVQKMSLPYSIIYIGNLCFGVYIFQQFILHYLYYCTNLSLIVGSNVLPWIGFLTALLNSLFLSYGLYSTRWGRKLI